MHSDRHTSVAANGSPRAVNRRKRIEVVGRFGAVAVAALIGSGCITIAGNNLSDIKPAQVGTPPSIEATVGDFSFHLDGGKMVTSTKAGRNLNKEILRRWEAKGWISKHDEIKSSKFTGRADYNVTLSGSQEGESSVALQVLSGVTLMIVPYSINSKMDLRYTLEHVPSGRVFEAQVSDSYRSVSSIVFLPVTIFAMGGAMRTWDRLASHLYDQFAKQGAFDPDSWGEGGTKPEQPASPDAAAERLKELQALREGGLVSEEEYEIKKREILKDL